MKAAVVTFQTRSGVGTQTVTGVVDRDGAAFVAKAVIFQSGYATLNALTTGAIPTNQYCDYLGIDTGTTRYSRANPDGYSPFNFKACAGAVSFGDYSILDGFITNFGQFNFFRVAKITAIRSGEFDLVYDQNDRTGDTIIAIALGGDDMDIIYTNYIIGIYACPSKPQGLLGLPGLGVPAASGFTTWGTGGTILPWGFSSRTGAEGTSDLVVVNQGNNWSCQRSGAWNSAIDQTTGAISGLSTVSSWDDSSFTIGANGGGTATPMVFCGENIRTAGGFITAPAAAGLQTFNTEIDAHILMFFSIGQVGATTVYQPIGQMITGWTTGPTSQAGYWTGEKTNGNTGQCFGARHLSNESVIRVGTPNAGATSFDSVAELFDLDRTGFATLNWQSVSGAATQIAWFAIGEVAQPPVPPVEPIIGCIAALPN